MVAIVYGSTTGNTEDAVAKIQAFFGEDNTELFDVKDAGLAALEYFDKLIFALPTWDYGEVQTDWQDVWDEIDETDFTNKTVAFVGMGDQFAYAEWFQDAMGMLHDKVIAKGATVIGHWPVEGYEFEASKALTEDKKSFVGLALDEDCQPELTEQRVNQWCEQIKPHLFG
ncbi:flavodoxin [Methylophaga frappieri]|uniref:Flavodoxin n=1 Tax=Methylophaga frappieri (strain ATCC BAA-2434 / DSM 25690 / JAM7) TaxID=754477 RepID=I1YIR7_METFJ|nr:flavodoxin [Methylophaga frappieri]AFJ02810.1 flavodoxin [Methylophaga frappieri]